MLMGVTCENLVRSLRPQETDIEKTLGRGLIFRSNVFLNSVNDSYY